MSRHLISVHLLFWLFNISITFYMWQLPAYRPTHVWVYALSVFFSHFISITYFYINYLWLLPRFLLKKRYLLYVLFISLAIAFNVFGCAYVWNNFTYIPDLFKQDQRGGIVFSCMLYWSVSTGIRMIEDWVHSENIRLSLEKETKDAEILYLQSQMNPHFLFNTLNNIYGLSLKNASQTSEAIAQLKWIMKYFQQFEVGTKITLTEEINYLNAYINIHKLRQDVVVDFDVNMINPNVVIEPMLLLPSVENAFKHGDMSKGIYIKLKQDMDGVYFSIKNSVSHSKRKDDVGGIGIHNIMRRLELLYPHKHSFHTETIGNVFSLTMTLNIG